MYKLLFLLLLLSTDSQAQLSEGYIKYSIQVIPQDSTQANLQSARMLRSSKIEILFAKDKHRINTTMGRINDKSIIYNRTTHELLTLTSNGKNKVAFKMNIDPAILNKKSVEVYPAIRKFKDSTRTILGFNCYYVEMMEKDQISTYWCTDDLNIELAGQSIVHPSIPGFPLSFSREQNGFKLTYIASNFSDAVNSDSFSMEIPEGYVDVTKKKN